MPNVLGKATSRVPAVRCQQLVGGAEEHTHAQCFREGDQSVGDQSVGDSRPAAQKSTPTPNVLGKATSRVATSRVAAQKSTPTAQKSTPMPNVLGKATSRVPAVRCQQLVGGAEEHTHAQCFREGDQSAGGAEEHTRCAVNRHIKV